MGLNIKNPRVHELARRAAAITGSTQTGAIEIALERLLRDYAVDPEAGPRKARADLVRGLVAEYVADPGDPRGPATIEDLYDEAGLPQ